MREEDLARYLNNLDASAVSIEHVASITDGASQAFLEELVYRAIQIGLDNNSRTLSNGVKLTDEMFDEAVEEMTSQNSRLTDSISGFTVQE